MTNDIIHFFSENWILSVIWFFLLIGIIALIIKDFFYNKHMINHDEAIKLIEQKNAVIVDTRSLKMFQDGHIINSIHITLENILLKPIHQLTLYNKNNPIILILTHQDQEKVCIQKLSEYGFFYIYILKNSLNNWNIKQCPLVTKN